MGTVALTSLATFVGEGVPDELRTLLMVIAIVYIIVAFSNRNQPGALSLRAMLIIAFVLVAVLALGSMQPQL